MRARKRMMQPSSWRERVENFHEAPSGCRLHHRQNASFLPGLCQPGYRTGSLRDSGRWVFRRSGQRSGRAVAGAQRSLSAGPVRARGRRSDPTGDPTRTPGPTDRAARRPAGPRSGSGYDGARRHAVDRLVSGCDGVRAFLRGRLHRRPARRRNRGRHRDRIRRECAVLPVLSAGSGTRGALPGGD